MTSSASYEIAGTDELEALGRDNAAFDTSAGLHPEDHVAREEYDAEPVASSKSRVCVILVVVILALAATAALLGFFLSRKSGSGGGSKSPTQSNPGQTQSSPQQPAPPPKPTAVSAPEPPSTTVPPAAAGTTTSAVSQEVKTYSIKVLDKAPHDGMAFTQGFEYANGFFYESTGLRGQSSLRRVEMDTGKVLQRYDFPDMTLFGEGMTLHTTHHIFMLTWQSGRGFIFNQTTFEVLKEWKYEGEGWGLCMDRQKDEVYMSDGTTVLRVLDPEDLKEKRKVTVTLKGKKVKDLNEIEWICGEVWANVWQTSHIYRIDPSTGRVKAIINASILPPRKDRTPSMDVLNGIAFDRQKGHLWLTGKKWPYVYQVSVTDDSLDLTNCK